MNLDYYAEKLADKALELGAIRLSPQKPFLWASGYYMPIYNDNRSILVDPQARQWISKAFELMLMEDGFDPENIAGTATAGIAFATTLADNLKKSMSYVRSSAKDHGLSHQIEGLGKGGTYNGKKVLVVEDLISTGGSSISAVKAVTAAGGICPYCYAIFSYGLNASTQAFAQVDPPCRAESILTYDFVLERAVKTNYVSQAERDVLKSWREDPFGWGGKNGFPREEK